MAVPVGQWAFNAGEVRPALFGHADLVRLHSACATLRNMWPYYSGGAFSRAGTAFVGYAKQRPPIPPRLIPFQFSIQQGRILEFGDFYMRVIVDGAYVTDESLPLTGATNANPLVITVPAAGGSSATPINSGVFASYTPGEVITLAGGVFSVPAQVQVDTTEVINVDATPGLGTGYAPSDTITLAGGTATTRAVVTINTTRVASAIVAAAGTGGANGNAIVAGTTGSGTRFAALVLISGGGIVSVLAITTPGSYTANPAAPASEPVTGAGLSGAELNLALAPESVSITNAGVFTANPPGGAFTQFTTSGLGTGAQFFGSAMGVQSATVVNIGSYATVPPNPVSQLSSTGGGGGVQFTMAWSGSGAGAFAVGDWLFFSGVGGMTELNGRTLIVKTVLTGGQYVLEDVYGVDVDSTAFGVFTTGGTVARIYTVVSPYAAVDLPWLKYVESADVMSLVCVNQTSQFEYQPYDLERFADNNWVFVAVTMAETISAPGSCFLFGTFNWSTFEAQQSGSTTTPVVASYQYVVTAVNPVDGSESVASPIGELDDAVDISITSGTIVVNWSTVTGAVQYNIYKATPTSQAAISGSPPPPVGALFGFAGTAFGNNFADNNIVADFAQTPPRHLNPFARGQIVGINGTAGGFGYSIAKAVITTSTGSNASVVAIVNSGQVVGYLMQDNGQNYAPTDTVTIVGDGVGATATLIFGAFSGTYPGTVTYFQARRGYANTLNNPDTYWFSQPGAFKNFDTRIPTIDSDAVTGSPWGQEVNGLQWFVVMPGGTIAMTGLGAWFVGGQGSSSFNPQPLTPQGQQALPETFNGVSPTVPPVRIDYDIVFVQSKGSRYRDIQVQYFTNIITGVDISLTSDHLFLGHQIIQHAWCEEPYKLLWSVRDDGILLSMTYYKPQEVLGWARHDTQGTVVSVASVTETPVDALYLVVERCANVTSGPAPPPTEYQVFIFDDSCFLYETSDFGVTWTTNNTPQTAGDWQSLEMAVNDGDHHTMTAFLFDQYLRDPSAPNASNAALTTSTGATGSWHYINPGESGVPGTLSNFQQFGSGTITHTIAGLIVVALPKAWSQLSWSYARISHDGGTTWADVTALGSGRYWTRACSSANGASIYVASGSASQSQALRVSASFDTGITWADITPPPTGTANDDLNGVCMRCDAAGNTVLFVSTWDEGIYLSRDSGSTWNTINPPLPPGVDPTLFFENGSEFASCGISPDGMRMIVGFGSELITAGGYPYNSYLATSLDGGNTWTFQTSPSILDLSFDISLTTCNTSSDGLGFVAGFQCLQGVGLTQLIYNADTSIDGGATWSSNSITPAIPNGDDLVNSYMFPVGSPPPGPTQSGAYLVERMDDRLWTDGVESTWCVDCALRSPQPEPAANLEVSSFLGVGAIVGVEDLIGGTNYSSRTTATVIDANGRGPGTGASVMLTISGGAITAVAVSTPGVGYIAPTLSIFDESGQGVDASATIILNNQATFTADANVFSPGNVGSVIRCGGGIATITAYTSPTVVQGSLTQPIVFGMCACGVCFTQGEWTMTAPFTVVGGLFQLVGSTVTGLMDGNPIPPTVVNADGEITLPAPATAVTVGLGFTPQLQSVYLEAGSPTIQGQRKKIGAATARVENSRGFQQGSNQMDGSTLNPIQESPLWQNMEPTPDLGVPAYQQGVMPLWTGDTRIAVANDLGKPGQIALQQLNPLPLNVTAIITESLEGDTPSQQAPKKQERGGGGGQRGG